MRPRGTIEATTIRPSLPPNKRVLGLVGSRATGAHSPEILMIEMAAYLSTVVKTEGGW